MAANLIAYAEQITDPAGVGEYAARAAEVVARYGGQYRTRAQAEVLEGTWQPGMLIIIEFESMDRLKAFYTGPEYAPLKELRQRSGVMNFVAVEGL